MSLNWFTHKGKRILNLDFSNEPDDDARSRLLAECAKVIIEQPNKTRLLINVTNVIIGRSHMIKTKKLISEAENQIEKHAVVGIDGLRSAILSTYNVINQKNPVKPFSDIEKAKDYLVEK